MAVNACDLVDSVYLPKSRPSAYFLFAGVSSSGRGLSLAVFAVSIFLVIDMVARSSLWLREWSVAHFC